MTNPESRGDARCRPGRRRAASARRDTGDRRATTVRSGRDSDPDSRWPPGWRPAGSVAECRGAVGTGRRPRAPGSRGADGCRTRACRSGGPCPASTSRRGTGSGRSRLVLADGTDESRLSCGRRHSRPPTRAPCAPSSTPSRMSPPLRLTGSGFVRTNRSSSRLAVCPPCGSDSGRSIATKRLVWSTTVGQIRNTLVPLRPTEERRLVLRKGMARLVSSG